MKRYPIVIILVGTSIENNYDSYYEEDNNLVNINRCNIINPNKDNTINDETTDYIYIYGMINYLINN